MITPNIAPEIAEGDGDVVPCIVDIFQIEIKKAHDTALALNGYILRISRRSSAFILPANTKVRPIAISQQPSGLPSPAQPRSNSSAGWLWLPSPAMATCT